MDFLAETFQVQNGCMWFVPKSHEEPELRPHRRVKEGHHLRMTDYCSNVSQLGNYKTLIKIIIYVSEKIIFKLVRGDTTAHPFRRVNRSHRKDLALHLRQ